MQVTDPFNQNFDQGAEVLGFKVVRKVELLELHAVFYELVHLKTNATHIHISIDDSENAFAVAFKTVPKDSSGVAHILEHTALCGSKLYPVRDPFFSMIKRSLNTFMNAFTAPDWTMYPFATQNEQDYYNLLSVYLDAAFFPALDELSFKQEGHRVEFNEHGKLEFKGVVYNEMKGAMSSPDQVMYHSIMKALYPTTTYHNNSGGDPNEIPKLTHEGLLKFHKTHYHPSNAMFFTYGNFPLMKHLTVINDHILRHFDLNLEAAKIEVKIEPKWSAPKDFRFYYALDEEEMAPNKSQVAMAWLTSDITDPKEMLVMEILSEILLGNAAAPLRKALMDTKLGSALADGSGFESDIRSAFFACGLKDTEARHLPKIRQVILDTITKLVEEGIDWNLTETAIHQIEFHRREISNAGYPFGLQLCLWFASCVLHGGDAVKAIQVKEGIEKITREAREERLLERSLKKYFLDNQNCISLTLEPDPNMDEAFRDNERVVLAEMLANLGEAEKNQIRADAEALEVLQESEEDLSVLPALTKNDIPVPVNTMLYNEEDTTVNTLFYHQNTSEISYFTAVAGLKNVDPELYPLLPFFGLCFTKMGTQDKTYDELSLALDKITGATQAAVSVYTDMRNGGGVLPLFTLSTKALLRNQDKMFELMAELFHRQNFSDLTRLEMLLKEYAAGLEAGIVRNGHGMAISLASRGLSQLKAFSEMTGGVHQYQYIKKLIADLDKAKLEEISANLGKIYKNMHYNSNFRFAFINNAQACENAKPAINKLFAGFPDGPDGIGQPADLPLATGVQEGWITTSAVAFDAAAQKCVTYRHEDAPVLALLAKLLRSVYLHREIREKGGAYGGMASYSPESGVFAMASYRDPHVVRTLETFDSARKYVTAENFDDEDVTEAILQVASDLGKPYTPGVAARMAFMREITGLTDIDRQTFKERILAADKERLIAVAAKYLADSNPVTRAVIAGREKLEHANELLKDKALELHNI